MAEMAGDDGGPGDDVPRRQAVKDQPGVVEMGRKLEVEGEDAVSDEAVGVEA